MYWTRSSISSVSVVDKLNTIRYKVSVSSGNVEHCVTQGQYQWWPY